MGSRRSSTLGFQNCVEDANDFHYRADYRLCDLVPGLRNRTDAQPDRFRSHRWPAVLADIYCRPILRSFPPGVHVLATDYRYPQAGHLVVVSVRYPNAGLVLRSSEH